MNVDPFTGKRSLIGMVHMPPTPGSPRSQNGMKTWDLDSLVEKSIGDARTLSENGVDGVLVENYHDTPFYPEEVPESTVEAMVTAVHEIKREIDLPVGVNVLRNCCKQAVSIAARTGASFIRCNVLAGVMVSNEGLLIGRAHEVIRYRDRDANGVKVFADVMVKHAQPLAPGDHFEEVAMDTIDRSGADAIVISGSRTGEPISDSRLDHVKRLRELRSGARIIAGSGVRPDNFGKIRELFDAFIVGTYFYEDDRAGNLGAGMKEIIPERVREMKQLMEAGD